MLQANPGLENGGRALEVNKSATTACAQNKDNQSVTISNSNKINSQPEIITLFNLDREVPMVTNPLANNTCFSFSSPNGQS